MVSSGVWLKRPDQWMQTETTEWRRLEMVREHQNLTGARGNKKAREREREREIYIYDNNIYIYMYIYMTIAYNLIRWATFRLQKVKKQRERWKIKARKGKDEKEDKNWNMKNQTSEFWFFQSHFLLLNAGKLNILPCFGPDWGCGHICTYIFMYACCDARFWPKFLPFQWSGSGPS